MRDSRATHDGLYAALALEDETLRCVVVEAKGNRLHQKKWSSDPLKFHLRSKELSEEKQLKAMHLVQMLISKALPEFIKSAKSSGKFRAIGISCPGVVNTKTNALTDIPRNSWKISESSTSLLLFNDIFKEFVSDPTTDIVVDNDAAMSALGERWEWLKEKDLQDFAYVRAGVGINGAVFRDGRPWRGDSHPEIGHIFVKPHQDDNDISQIDEDQRSCLCPFHQDSCLEGRAGSKRISVLSRERGAEKADEIFCYYMAQLLYHVSLFAAPPEIILSGPSITNNQDVAKIIDRITQDFFKIKSRYPRYPLSSDKQFVKLAKLRASDASLRGALFAALRRKLEASLAGSAS